MNAIYRSSRCTSASSMRHDPTLTPFMAGGLTVSRSSVSIWCERVIEGGWLLALLLIPTYFNLLSARHFEPDKATTLRSIVMVMLAVALIDALERLVNRRVAVERASEAPWWRRIAAVPLAIPTILYAAVFLLATFVSIAPAVSFWGSYQRLQGTFTNLSYISLGVLIALYLRRREQLDRLVTVMILACLIAACYGLVQHMQLDPLPWRGDVVSRVASTMGNSIFVAAYMIMVLPYALYRGIVAVHQARSADASTSRPLIDLGWGAAYVLLALSALALVFAAMMFGAVVRAADLRYWWVYPGALVVAGGLFLLIALAPHRTERLTFSALIPGALLLGYVVFLGISYTLGQGPNQRVVPLEGRPGVEWPLWLGIAVALMASGYALVILLPRRANGLSRLGLILEAIGAFTIAALLLAATFFTQSRGPWLGGFAALFVFFTLLLVLALRRAQQHNPTRARLWRGLLIGEVALAIALAGFLAAFNLSDAPVFQQLREVPYIGRMGRLLEVETGTGRVRWLIWFGDDKAGGAAALIRSDPLRMIVGWGPETMFVAYNPFYPPSLTSLEARTASPDRSHQAYLDEVINKGILGLISYLFLLFSFFTLAWRLASRVTDWNLQALITAAIAAVTGHAVEGLTGIPIVSTLMIQWVSFALVVAAGGIAGAYCLPGAAPVQPAPASPLSAAAPASSSARQRGGRRAQAVKRGSSPAGRATASRTRSEGRAAAVAVYAVILILVFFGIWTFNVDSVLADMRLQQAQGYIDNPGARLDQQIIGASYLLDAIRMEPDQDFYYLTLGRSLMTIVSLRAEEARRSGAPLGQVDPNASVAKLLQLDDAAALQAFVLQRTPMELMSYAHAVLLRAQQLAPLNKDHAANLARMHNFWYQNLSGSQDRNALMQAIEWYRKAHAIAPQDVAILNEYASAVARSGDYEQALALLEKSRNLDPLYNDTLLRKGEILRAQGRYAEAVDQYLALLDRDPYALDGQISAIATALAPDPVQLMRLRDKYVALQTSRSGDPQLSSIIGLLSVRAGDLETAAGAFAEAVRLQPDNLEARQNYTLVLSDLLRYDQAAQQAQELLTLVSQRQESTDQQRAAIEALLGYLRQRASGG
ncbi:MAG: tetratricopeptide repeat protein [Roseiflexus sp.]|nr:tetratricopeptide repeat protein [Roseiflexus sp.]MCS7288582.1 tetratricopeptide repeat protein [Roseiflexus sp.]MDW8232037.1 tetratricopeptide repeat protein [Roseiflexaceae bacterium]